MERIKRIAWMSIGYIILFTCITWLTALAKGQPFRFDIYMDLIGAVLCGITTELVPKPKR